MPALPLDEAGKYVAAAFVVFLGLVLVYVAIMAGKLARIEKELGELTELAEGRDGATGSAAAEPAAPAQAAALAEERS